MAQIISFFNHKGGVGKTTLAYNVAWGLAQENKRVLMIDADPQCNLTEISILGFDDLDGQMSLFDVANETSKKNTDIYNYFKSYVEPEPGTSEPVINLYEKKENLKLLLGSIRLAELEETISLSLAGIGGLRHVPESTHRALRRLSEDFDYVIVDLSPALSAINQLFVMLSDYFIVPVNPSIFSRQALDNLYEIFRTWNRKLSSFDIFSRKGKALPQMLGIVCQNYRPYSRKDEANTKSAMRFEERLNELNKRAVKLSRDLSGFAMALTEDEFRAVFAGSDPYRIANIPDYNQLGVVSETEKMPVNGFDDKILNKHDLATPVYKEKVADFKVECQKIVDGLLNLAN